MHVSIKRYFVKKPIKAIQKESTAPGLKRTLNAMNLVSLGIGCIIGAGIFVLTGKAAAAHAGPAIMLSFVLAGFACIFAAFCYAELASVLPVSGSAYTYAYATLGELAAWAMGWLLILEYGLSASTVAVGWSGYVVSFLRDFNINIPPEYANPLGLLLTNPDGSPMLNAAGEQIKGIFNVPAFIGILGTTWLLIIGVRESAKVNNIIVIVKLAVIVAFIAIGAFYVDTANWHPFIPPATGKPGEYGFDGVLKAAGVIFFAYIGFEAVSTAAQEAKNPQKDMAIGILGSLAICTVLYIAVSAVLTGIVHYSLLNVPDPMALAVDKIGIRWLSFVIKVGAIMGLSSVMLVLIYGQTRIFYTIARDGLLPKFFSTLHPKYHTPYLNTAFIGLIVSLAAGLVPLSTLGDLVSMGTLFAFAIVCFSVLYLRIKEPKLKRPFKTPMMPLTPVLGILSCGYLMYGLGWTVFVNLKLYFFAGIALYFLYGQFHSKYRKAS
ncbi:MAG: amino acid permease [Proteobacteria bacterium]|nr:amino acid permease [Pseudomonadota bacterium]